ncbi:MAG TPA: dihydrodipicolinate reductase [Mycobacteriales bacterium]|nr:dihydrodipicolinate reductase [Mycobacteriales bacterium]
MEIARVVQWTTGLVAKQAVPVIAARPDLELVGVYAYSKDKVGKDAGELVGLDHALGVTATDDIDALIALRPDCVVYMPLHADVAHLTQLLRAGINVVTTAFVTGRMMSETDRLALDAAAREGGASLFGSGIHPGQTDMLAALASSICSDIYYVKVSESVDLTLWAAEPNQDELGWGRPKDDPGHKEDLAYATRIDKDSLDVIAKLLDIPLDDTRCEVELAHATKDIDIPGRPIKEGHVAGMDIRWIGTSGGADAVEVNLRWTLGTDLDVQWAPPEGFLLEVKGNPYVAVRMMFMPEDLTNLTVESMAAVGHLTTAMPVVNAIHAVVAAPPGIVTYADLAPMTAPFVPRPAAST